MTAAAGRSRSRCNAYLCTAVGVIGLAPFAFAYWFSVEPAPGIRVVWREGVSLEQQARLERRYLLANRGSPHPEQPRSLAYDLLDTRRSNIHALLHDPTVEDTNDIDDEWDRVRLGTASSDAWMWVAHRTPGLRQPEARWALILTLIATTGVGLWRLSRAPDSPPRE